MATNFETIYLLQMPHSYFDKIIKRYETIAEYVDAATYSFVDNRNFDPGNDVTTDLIIGTNGTSAISFNGNYLLVTGVKTEVINGIATQVTFIKSRWWVLEQKRTRSGQYHLQLKRDVIADHYSIVTEAPCFIEKATIRDFSNPLIFNKEDMNFNQIKKSETMLKDETKMPWLVGYIARNYSGGTFTTTYDVRADYVSLPFAVGSYKAPYNIKIDLYSLFKIQQDYTRLRTLCYIAFDDSTFENYHANNNLALKMDPNNIEWWEVYKFKFNGSVAVDPGPYATSVANYIYNNRATIESAFNSTYSYTSASDMETISNMNGKIYKDANNKYYKIIISEQTTDTRKWIVSNSAFGVSIDAGIKRPVNDGYFDLTSLYSSPEGYTCFHAKERTLTISLQEYTPDGYSITLSSSRNRLNDAPYDMFAIPYPIAPNTAVMTSYTDELHYNFFYIAKENSLHIAEAIAAQLGPNDYVYDIQILPYCPIDNVMVNFEIGVNLYDDFISLIGFTENKDYNVVSTTGDSPTKVGVIFWGTHSHKTFDIYQTINVVNPKIENETKMYRLVSPNYSGMFEFSPAKNNSVNFFNVDITFKPYSPYIHVNPNFGFMYGQDFNDSRGLICGGDFSIALADDKWASFEINNKNYQLIFDREVRNMDFTRNQERMRQIFGGATGVIQGAVTGGATGGWAGAAVGAAASAGGAIIDYQMSEKQYKEQVSLKTDLYGYNLGNIKALPSSLVKSMSLNENFKFWPFIEEYECSEEEKEALINKLKYDGMTVMKIGKISDYLVANEESFVKGQIIRLENLPEASDVAYEIYNEIKKGVFM